MTGAAGHLTVSVDAGTCVGSGQCELYCEAVFRLDGDVATVVDAHPPPEHHDAVRDAADACPSQAITLTPTPTPTP